MQRTVSTAVGDIAYELTKKRVKNGNLRVHPDGSVHVSVPQRSPLAFADELVRQRAEWIVRTRKRLAARQPDAPADGGTIRLLGECCLLRLAPGDAAYLERRGDRLCGTLPDPADAAALAECQYMLTKPLCLVCDDAAVLEQALRVYQGRALYEGALPENLLRPLAGKYGLLY